jgi:hypothetical protein
MADLTLFNLFYKKTKLYHQTFLNILAKTHKLKTNKNNNQFTINKIILFI